MGGEISDLPPWGALSQATTYSPDWRSFGEIDGDIAEVVAQRFEIATLTDGFESGDTSEWTSVFP